MFARMNTYRTSCVDSLGEVWCHDSRAHRPYRTGCTKLYGNISFISFRLFPSSSRKPLRFRVPHRHMLSVARAARKIQATYFLSSTIFRSRRAARKSHRPPKTPPLYPAQCITCDAALDRALHLSCCRSCGFLVGYLLVGFPSHVIPYCSTTAFALLACPLRYSPPQRLFFFPIQFNFYIHV